MAIPWMVTGAIGRAGADFLPGYRQRRREDEEYLIQSQDRSEARNQREANRRFGRLLAEAMTSPDRKVAIESLMSKAASDPALQGVSPEILAKVPEYLSQLDEQQYRRTRDTRGDLIGQQTYEANLISQARGRGEKPVFAEQANPTTGYRSLTGYEPLSREELPLETRAQIDARNRQYVKPPPGVDEFKWSSEREKTRSAALNEWEKYHAHKTETWKGDSLITDTVAKPGHPERDEFVEQRVFEHMETLARDIQSRGGKLPPSAGEYINRQSSTEPPEMLRKPSGEEYKVYRPGESTPRPSAQDTARSIMGRGDQGFFDARPAVSDTVSAPPAPGAMAPSSGQPGVNDLIADFAAVVDSVATARGMSKQAVADQMLRVMEPTDPRRMLIERNRASLGF